MKVRCPRCEKKLSVPDKYAGRAVRCPACNRAFNLPTPKVAVSGPGAGSALDLESLARMESQTTEMGSEDLTEAQAALAAQAGPGQANERICPNCGKPTPVKDMNLEVLCSHCWQPIPAKAGTDAYDTGDTKLVGYKGATVSTLGFYDGLSTSFSYPFYAVGSLFTAVLVAVAVIMLPVAMMTAVAQATEQAAAGTKAGVQAADLSMVQVLLRVAFGVQVAFFSAVGVHAFLDVIRATSVGNEQPPPLNWNPSNWGKSIVAYFALLIYALVSTYIVLFFAEGGVPKIPLSIEDATAYLMRPGVYIGLIIVSSVIPMNLIGLALGTVAQGLNPLNVFKSILGTHVNYIFLVVIVCVFGAMAVAAFVSILAWFLPQVDKMVTGSKDGNLLSVAGGLLAWGAVIGFGFIALYMLGRLHGLFARSYRKKLLFGER